MRCAVLAIVILALAASGYACMALFPRSSTTTLASGYSEPAPDFRLPEISSSGLTGRKVGLADFEGRPVFLEFMSPLCGHCLKMTPIIRNLEKKYGDRVVFISVMLANASDEAYQRISIEFIRKYGLDWIHVMDSDMSVFKKYDVQGTPTYVILDKEHVEVARFIGSDTSEEDLEKALRKVA